MRSSSCCRRSTAPACRRGRGRRRWRRHERHGLAAHGRQAGGRARRQVGAAAGGVPARDRRRGRGAGQWLGHAVEDRGGAPDGAGDVAALGGDDERAAVGLGSGVVVEGEVAQAVVDVGPAEVAATEQDVGARADDDVGPRLDELLRQWLLLGVRAGLGLGAPVHVDDHGVRRAPHLLDLAHQLGRVDRRGHAGLGRRRRPRADQVVGDHLRRRDDRHALAVDRHPVGREGLRRGVADADDRVAGLRGDRQVL